MSDDLDLSEDAYPRTWLLLDVVDDGPRLLGQEVVDLAPGAIELRHAARDLRGYAEERDRWLRLDDRGRWPRLESGHRRSLSFGPEIAYCVEHDATSRIHGGRPFRHLAVRSGGHVLTPATSAEIGVYFYGRRSAAFGFIDRGRAHGYIGLDWESLDQDDVRWLLRREMKDE